MKLTLTAFLLSTTVTATATAAAFVCPSIQQQQTSTTSLSASSSDRRGFLFDAVAAAGLTTLLLPAQAAFAEPRPTYLIEPTQEFLVNEEKAMVFKRAQLAIKKEFTTILERLVSEPDDEALLVKDLKDLKALIAKTGGLPLGIQKVDMFKMIRTKKAKGFWPTDVEIA
jgi:hypothetical protein